MTRPSRNGYSLLLVLVFMVLMLSLTSIAYKEIAAMLRIEAVHTAHINRDAGSLEALARALALLQTGTPPSSPYVTGVTLSSESEADPRKFTVTMTSAAVGLWTVNVAPTPDGSTPTPMPTTF